MNHATFAKLAAVPTMCLAVLCTGVAIQGQTAPQKTASKAKAAAKATIDLNKATSDELQELPGVGEVTAKKIIDGRPYSKVDDLAQAGVPARVISSIRSQVHVGEAAVAKAKAKMKEADAPEPKAASAKVNLNSANQAALEELPGIGPSHAKAIIEARPFKSVDDLERVKGLGKARIDALRDLVTTTVPAAASPKAVTAKGATTKETTKEMPKLKDGQKININTASKDELDVLPGIGPVRAQAIIDGRPFKAIEDVMKVKGIKEIEFGKIKDLISVK
jgi:competence protein ComEA